MQEVGANNFGNVQETYSIISFYFAFLGLSADVSEGIGLGRKQKNPC